MSVEHNDVMGHLGFLLQEQLDRAVYRVRVNSARLSRADETYYIPDVAVVPVALIHAKRQQPGTLEVYSEPLPLVAEVWSPSTGDYDVDAKIPEYQRRGDLEIWRLHPYERTLTAWQRQPDGTYAKQSHVGGTVQPRSLPGVQIDLDRLFD